MPYGKCYKCGSAYCSNDCDIPETDEFESDMEYAFRMEYMAKNPGQFTMECPGGEKCECDYYNESE